MLSTRAVQAAARQRMAGYVAATGKNGLKQNRSFLGDFLEINWRACPGLFGLV